MEQRMKWRALYAFEEIELMYLDQERLEVTKIPKSLYESTDLIGCMVVDGVRVRIGP